MLTYRSLLETLKWSDPGTVLQTAVVSQLWRRVCDSKELWFSLLDYASFRTEEIDSVLSPKETYRSINDLRRQKRCLIVDESKVAVYSCFLRKTLQVWNRAVFPGNYFCAAVLLSHHKVLFCGGNTENCSIFDMNSGVVQSTAPMQRQRTYHGALLLDQVVYVFGAEETTSDRTAERFDLLTWTPLPDMISGRSAFNPCQKSHLIYLCGGNTPLCEVFDTDRCAYTALPHSLEVSNWTVSFFYKDELVSVIDDMMHYHRDNGTIESVQYARTLIP